MSSSPIDLEKKNHHASESDEDLKAGILDLAVPAERQSSSSKRLGTRRSLLKRTS